MMSSYINLSSYIELDDERRHENSQTLDDVADHVDESRAHVDVLVWAVFNSLYLTQRDPLTVLWQKVQRPAITRRVHAGVAGGHFL